jgi:hypothetical protein
MDNLDSYEYQTISIAPEGIRIKGDDVSEKLADLLNKKSNELGWKKLEDNFNLTFITKRRGGRKTFNYT